MTDDELRRHFQYRGDAAPDFSKILERQKRRYRPRPLVLGLLILSIATPPLGWVWTNTGEKQIANRDHKMETITQNSLPAPPASTKNASPAGAATAAAPERVMMVFKPPAAARGAACKLDPVMSTHTLPPYPSVSAQLGEKGTTSLQITVARDGHVRDARKVTHGSGFPRLDQAAASFVRQNYLWRPMACGSAKTKLNVVWALDPGQAR